MANRTVKTTLIATVAGYVTGMEQAARATRETTSAAQKLAAQKQAMQQLGVTMVAFGAVAAAGVAIAIKKFADFDQAMSNVQAATHETAENMELLRQAALDAGAATVFSATESANAIEELSKAGLSAQDILGGGLAGALDLAAAGGIGVARAAEIASTSMKQFSLEGSEAEHVADLLAAGAGKAVGGVDDIAQALNQAGLVASQFGLSIEETVGTLSAFAANSLLGSDAGTSFRTMLLRLANPTEEVKSLMADIGFEAYNASGRFIGLAGLAGELQSSLKGMTEQQEQTTLAMIFGQDAIRASTILLKEGEDGIHDWTDAVDDQGYAAETAALRLDNLAGDVEKLGGAFDTALIKSGSAANDSLRKLVQTATFLVDGIGELPQPVLDVGFALGTAASSIGLVSGAALLAVPKLADFRIGLAKLGISGRVAATGLGVTSVAIAGALIAFNAWATAQAEAKARTDAYTDSLAEQGGAFTDYTRDLVVARFEERGALESAEQLGLAHSDLTDAVLGEADALARVNRVIDEHGITAEEAAWGVESLSQARIEEIAAAGRMRTALEEVSGELASAVSAHERETKAQSTARQETARNERALAEMRGEVYRATEDLDKLAATIRGFGSATLSTRDAERQFQDAIDEAATSLEEQGATLDINTEAGRANERTLDDMARAALELSAARYEETGSQEAASAAIAAGRQSLIDQLAQYGITGQAAEDYANALGLIPGNITTIAQLDTSVATASALEYEALLARIAGFSGVDQELIRKGWRPSEFSYGPPKVNATGGFYESGVRAFQNGGESFPSGIYKGGQNIHKFAETGLPWETYISPKPGYERENISYALESLSRLGYQMPSQEARPVEINAHGVDPQTVAELVYQRMVSEMRP